MFLLYFDFFLIQHTPQKHKYAKIAVQKYQKFEFKIPHLICVLLRQKNITYNVVIKVMTFLIVALVNLFLQKFRHLSIIGFQEIC